MGTTTTQQGTNQFNQAGTNALNQMTPAMGTTATNYMNNPFGNPFFQQQQQLGGQQARGLGGTQMSNIANNMATSGIGGGGAAPFQQEQMQNQARANSGMQAQLGFMNPVNQALGMQQNAMGLAAGYKPLQTGQTQTTSTGGAGTWLSALTGGLLGALNPVSSLFGGGGGSAPGAMSGTPGAMGSLYGSMPQGQGGSNNPFTFQPYQPGGAPPVFPMPGGGGQSPYQYEQ